MPKPWNGGSEPGWGTYAGRWQDGPALRCFDGRQWLGSRTIGRRVRGCQRPGYSRLFGRANRRSRRTPGRTAAVVATRRQRQPTRQSGELKSRYWCEQGWGGKLSLTCARHVRRIYNATWYCTIYYETCYGN